MHALLRVCRQQLSVQCSRSTIRTVRGFATASRHTAVHSQSAPRPYQTTLTYGLARGATTRTSSQLWARGYSSIRQLPHKGKLRRKSKDKDNSIKLSFSRPPKTVLIVKKPGSQESAAAGLQIAELLKKKWGIRCIVEKKVSHEFPGFLSFAEDEADLLQNVVDFVITLGGDGTIMHVSTLFKRDCPPILSFHFGTLGFLVTYDIAEYERALTKVISQPFGVTQRDRLLVEVMSPRKLNENRRRFQVLNEVIVHRCEGSYLMTVGVSINDTYLTKVTGDGLLISTPTGSTAYALSAGGTLVHPEINGMMLSPICPRSLYTRPVILPMHSTVAIEVISEDLTIMNRGWILELQKGDNILCRKSRYPIFTICEEDAIADWISDIRDTMAWNRHTIPVHAGHSA